MADDLVARLDACTAVIRKKAPGFTPKLGIILGSGLGAFADSLERAVSIDYRELPDFPVSSVHGHAGRLVLGHRGEVPVVAMQGRVHFYEGYQPWQVAFPARVLGRLGIKHLTVTNAAGGINLGFKVGDLMAITDHLNLAGFNPLIGKNADELGPRFPDMSHAYDPASLEVLRGAAKAEGVQLREGVYASLSGPSYETPAEIRMLRTLGGDAVGMSTVPEVIVASHMGIKVTGISCITNLAAGIGKNALNHEEVSEVANRVTQTFQKLIGRFLADVATKF
ncbi:MAG: purine-nucleoside phosphorylase [Archangium sp.]|nr:purine-nucleoside phosphorylase [Archangium sp.]MDP3151976.1 purine-nucleoside phosphorylase [Archangium sp.]MDP3571389.1 purine-nucleoside phosphorylase [Archangium sp.]